MGREFTPAEEKPYNLVVPRSACPGCGRGIKAIENIPIFSWLALRGKCAGCGMRISARYPLVELLAGAGAAWSAWQFGFGLAAFGAMLFLWCTIALAFIDHATGYLPDDITLPLLWAGLFRKKTRTLLTLASIVIAFISFSPRCSRSFSTLHPVFSTL
jgi:leader peptidase (prepilin peptidase)/N-methyltransferase